MARIDYEAASTAYNAGRAGPASSRANWRPLLESLWDGRDSHPILDLGAGTRIWSESLAVWLRVKVIALEPSEGMRGQARPAHDVIWVGGMAEQLPFREETIAGAWLSTVIHHVDLQQVAAELRRVLRRGGVVWVRSSFPDRSYDLGVNRFFPEARRVWNSFPSVGDVKDAFASNGFSFVLEQRVPEPAWDTLAERRRGVVRSRWADSLLASLTDVEFNRGLARIDAALRAGDSEVPSDGLDLLAFELPP